MLYRFCNKGHCFDFNPAHKMQENPTSTPILNLNYYILRVREANDPSVYIMDEFGKIIEG